MNEEYYWSNYSITASYPHPFLPLHNTSPIPLPIIQPPPAQTIPINHPDNGTLSTEAGRMDQWHLPVPTAIPAGGGSAL